MNLIHRIDHYLEEHLNQSIAELSQLCEQPSVSAQNWGIEDTAHLVEKMLKKRGFETQIIPTDGAPVVTAFRAGRSERTVLFYNHYDVQPPEPLELWASPPFQPTLRDGMLFARGVSDDKGHFTSRLFAIDAILAEEGELPCTVKFILEGEEETSSVHLAPFV
ncbi:MAG: M20/M25/M40 family metallo-hydrolase, partial [Bellilinea sp.]|nr:M20/M25/M40 family metallo-hydrolase [Bellilinea sp.]